MSMTNLKNHSQKGIGLIEIIGALGLSTVVIVAVATLSIKTLKTSVEGKMQLQVTKIANRELENVRAIRETSPAWQNGVDGFLDKVSACIRTGGSTSQKCSIDPASLAVSNSPATSGTGVDAITRYFYVTYPNSGNTNLVRVSVDVSYISGSTNKTTHTYTEFTNWRSSQ